MAVVQIKKGGLLGGVCVCVCVCVCVVSDRDRKREKRKEKARETDRERKRDRPDGVVLLWCKEIKSPWAHF